MHFKVAEHIMAIICIDLKKLHFNTKKQKIFSKNNVARQLISQRKKLIDMKYAKKKYKHPQPATIIYITLNVTKVLKCKRNAKGRK